jgi:hypothetical protein
MGKIDWKRDYGYEAPSHAFLVQDGRRYNLAGQEVDDAGRVIEDPPVEEKKKRSSSSTGSTVQEIKAALDDLRVSYPANATKTELLDLLNKEVSKDDVEA